MTLEQAKKFAEAVVGWLRPHCFRIEVAGSIRRERKECADVDIVCVPRDAVVTKGVSTDLWGERKEQVLTNEVWLFLTGYVHENALRGARWRVRENPFAKVTDKVTDEVSAWRPAHDAENLLVQLPKCELDVWLADESNFGTRLLCRTGSKEFNVWLCQKAKERGMKWNPYRGLEVDGELDGEMELVGREEREILERLGVGWVEPKERER